MCAWNVRWKLFSSHNLSSAPLFFFCIGSRRSGRKERGKKEPPPFFFLGWGLIIPQPFFLCSVLGFLLHSAFVWFRGLVGAPGLEKQGCRVGGVVGWAWTHFPFPLLLLRSVLSEVKLRFL